MSDVIRIKCWSCHEGMTLFEHGEAYGMCPCCGIEVDLKGYLATALQENLALKAEAKALRDEVSAANDRADTLEHRMMGMMTRNFAESWRKRDTQKELDGYLSAGIAELERERNAALEEVAALRARVVVVPEQVMRALDDARKFVDAAFYVGLCKHSASRELYRDGTYALAEHREAKKNPKTALEDAEEAEIALLCSPLFVGESLYPASAEEMQARLNAKSISADTLRRIDLVLAALRSHDFHGIIASTIGDNWREEVDAMRCELRELLDEGKES